MFFNKRKKFNGQVAVLLPAFGIDLDSAGSFSVLNVCDGEWEKGFNQYEAALSVAYLYVAGLYNRSRDTEADELIETRLNPVQGDWIKKGIVDPDNIFEFRKNAERIWERERSQNGGGVDKNSLIKELAKSRVRNDPIAAIGFDESMVDSLSGMQLAGLPEGTIVTIVETWALLKKKGIPDEEILQRIENHRSRGCGGGSLPIASTLSSYVKYRVHLENETGAQIADEFIEEAVEISKDKYRAA